jgi:hypothetical protein
MHPHGYPQISEMLSRFLGNVSDATFPLANKSKQESMGETTSLAINAEFSLIKEAGTII